MTSLTHTAPSIWLRRRSLDSRLARGASPDETPELAVRARQLLSRRQRERLADGIERAVHTAEQHSRPFSATAPLDNEAVRDARGDLLVLALELRSSGPLHPRGVALAEELLTNGSSPLYESNGNSGLKAAARDALEAL